MAYASSLKLFTSGFKKEVSFTGSFPAYFVHCVIYVIIWILLFFSNYYRLLNIVILVLYTTFLVKILKTVLQSFMS